ncbi:MAG: DNA translocase FtsK [Clostridia bacterium]|nr:DNA translocase FtsK [Clostridia bacterium]
MPLYDIENKQTPSKISQILTRRVVSFVLIGIALIGCLAIFTEWLPILKKITMGTFGLFSVVLCVILFVLSVILFQNKKITNTPVMVIFVAISCYTLLCVFSLAYDKVDLNISFFEHIRQIFTRKYSLGGTLAAITVYPLCFFTDIFSAYIIYGIIFVISTGIALQIGFNTHYQKVSQRNSINAYDTGYESKFVNQMSLNEILQSPILTNNNNTEKDDDTEKYTNVKNTEPINLSQFEQINNFREPKVPERLINQDIKSGLEASRKKTYIVATSQEICKKDDNGINRFESILSSKKDNDSVKYRDTTVIDEEKRNKLVKEYNLSELFGGTNTTQETRQEEKSSFSGMEELYEEKHNKLKKEQESINFQTPKQEKQILNLKTETVEKPKTKLEQEIFKTFNDDSQEDDQAEQEDDNLNLGILEDFSQGNISSQVKPKENGKFKMDYDFSTNTLKNKTEIKQNEPKPKPKRRPYNAPPLSLLSEIVTERHDNTEECIYNAQRIENEFNCFKIPVKVVEYIQGTRVTRYVLKVPSGIKLPSLREYSNNIKAAVKSKQDIIMYTPLDGDDKVGIDVPNNKIPMVSFKDIIRSDEFSKSNTKDKFVVGKTLTGENLFARLKDLPHMLVAGSTGSGKSVFLNSLLISLIYQAGPEDLRIILVDPKFVEFSDYEGIPHMLLKETISDVEKAIQALNFAVEEMNDRYKMLKGLGCKNYDDYLKLPEIVNGTIEKKPRILIVIDEIGDLMCSENKKGLEKNIVLLAQKARAAGIHLVLATQRPTADVVTGNIKTNLPTRVAFKLGSNIDSRTIMDQGGAERLLGKGDMLFKIDSKPTPERLQGCFLDGQDIKRVTDYIRENNDCIFDEEIEQRINKMGGEINISTQKLETKEDNNTSLIKSGVRVCLLAGYASTSLLEKRLSIGYMKASRLMDSLIEYGFVSETTNQQNRKTVLITEDQFEEKFGEPL